MGTMECHIGARIWPWRLDSRQNFERKVGKVVEEVTISLYPFLAAQANGRLASLCKCGFSSLGAFRDTLTDLVDLEKNMGCELKACS